MRDIHDLEVEKKSAEKVLHLGLPQILAHLVIS
jgi:hypothetical protein